MVAVDKSVSHDILRLVRTLIDVAAGIVAVAYPGITAEVLVYIVGFWAIFGNPATERRRPRTGGPAPGIRRESHAGRGPETGQGADYRFRRP